MSLQGERTRLCGVGLGRLSHWDASGSFHPIHQSHSAVSVVGRLLQGLLRRFTRRRELLPYNYGQPDQPQLKMGDRLIIVSQNEGIDYVAMSCRMSDTRYMRKGKRTPWKVIKVFDDGSLLCEHKGNRIIDKYLGWKGGNSVGAPHVPFLHSGLEFRVYYEQN